MSLLNPGFPPAYAYGAQPARFGAETSTSAPPSDTSTGTWLLLGGIAAFFGIMVVSDMVTPDAPVGGSDDGILARIKAERAARDAGFSKAAYHTGMIKNLDRVGAQKARLADWKASR